MAAVLMLSAIPLSYYLNGVVLDPRNRLYDFLLFGGIKQLEELLCFVKRRFQEQGADPKPLKNQLITQLT